MDAMKKPTIIFTTKKALAARGLKLVPASEWSLPSGEANPRG
jgi:hypothetical protein